MTPLVLLHGFTGHPDAWSEVRARLRTRPVLTPLLLGHGDGNGDGDAADFFAEVDRLAALIGALGEPADLCGYSLGGRVALHLLARHPRLFRRATLISARAPLDDARMRAQRAAADEAWCDLLDRGIDAFVERWEAQSLFAGRRALDPARRARLAALRRAHDPAGLQRALRRLGLAQMPPLDVARLAVPVHLLSGADDAAFTAHAAALAARLPRAIHTAVGSAGHDLTSERPDRVARALDEEGGPS